MLRNTSFIPSAQILSATALDETPDEEGKTPAELHPMECVANFISPEPHPCTFDKEYLEKGSKLLEQLIEDRDARIRVGLYRSKNQRETADLMGVDITEVEAREHPGVFAMECSRRRGTKAREMLIQKPLKLLS